MANRKITTTNLDFDQIKANFKTFLEGQDRFSDYDFEGSGWAVLLDVLAYNTHYNALLHNLAVNEAFLDSAAKRSSAVSKAKELGYVPASARATTAVLRVVMVNDAVSPPDTLTVSRDDKFTTTIDGTSYTFYAQDTYTAENDGGVYTFEGVSVKEGVQVTNTFVYTGTVSEFLIPNSGIDTTTLRVQVQSANSATAATYTLATSLANVDETSLVYFLKEVDNNFHYVEFGNDVVGKALDSGDVITCTYLIPAQADANGARSFVYAETAPADTTVYVTTTTAGYGGAAPEDIDTIKWNAPRIYTAQNRLVTIEDYRAIIQAQYPSAQAIHVWGGELNNPPEYGNVYIAIKPVDAETLTDGEKDYIVDTILEPRKVITMHPIIVDPDYLYVQANTTFYYNPNDTSLNSEQLSALVRQEILDYSTNVLSRFGGILKYSKLNAEIDGSEDSITNSITTLKLQKIVQPEYGLTAEYVVEIGNPIYNAGCPENAVHSSPFRVLGVSQTVYIDDVPTEGEDVGVLRMIYYNNTGAKVVLKSNVGSVVYSTGQLTLNDLTITGVVSDDFRFIIKPQSYDVAARHNQIVYIPDSLITVKALVDKNSDQYTFTNSRS